MQTQFIRNKLRHYMGVTSYCLSFRFYEQLKLPFLTYLTEGVVINEKHSGQLKKANI